MSTHANMVKMTAASPGTGTITLGSASSGHRTFAQGYNSADATVAGIRIEDAADSTIWEVARDCAYTHTGTTLGRGTFENSSTGSLVNFTGAVVVSVVATADAGRRWDSAGLQSAAATVTTADVTGVVGQLHELDISGLTAARSFVLPAVAAVNDRVGVRITAGYTAANYTYGLILKANTGDTLHGVSAAEWSRLIITGEMVIMRCTVANTTWMVDYDGRIAQQGSIELTTLSDGNALDTYVRPTQTSTAGAWTSILDVGAVVSTGLDAIYARRGNNFQISIGYVNKDAGTLGAYMNAGAFVNGTTEKVNAFWTLNSANTGRAAASKLVALASGEYVQFQYRTGTANIGAAAAASNYLTMCEIL